MLILDFDILGIIFMGDFIICWDTSAVHTELEKLTMWKLRPFRCALSTETSVFFGEAQRMASPPPLAGDTKTSACTQKRRDTGTEKKPREDGGRDWRYVATSLGMLGAPRS